MYEKVCDVRVGICPECGSSNIVAIMACKQEFDPYLEAMCWVGVEMEDEEFKTYCMDCEGYSDTFKVIEAEIRKKTRIKSISDFIQGEA